MRDEVVAEELVGEGEVVSGEEDGDFGTGAGRVVSVCVVGGLRAGYGQCGEFLFVVVGGSGGSDGFDGR